MPCAATRALSMVYWPITAFTSRITTSVSLATHPLAAADFGPMMMKW